MGILGKIFGQEDGKVQAASDQSQDERNLAAFVKNRVEEARNHPSRIANEGIWMTNIAYLLGYDGIYYDPQTRQFKPASTRSPYLKRNRIFVNKILPSVQNRLARLCKNPPQFDIRPNSPDAEAKEQARFKLQVLQMLWDKQELSTKRQELYMWMQQCGHSYVKVGYDAELGELILDPESGEMIFEGDVRTDVVSPFEVFADPLAKTLADATWVCHAKVRKLDYFRDHYPERGGAVKEEGAWLLSAQYEQRVNALNNINGAQGSAQQQMKNCAIELAYYERRSKKHPNGRLIITSNGILLHDGELPVGDIPFAKFDDVLIGGKYHSEAVITHLRPLQDRKNELLSAKAAWIRKLLAGKYIAAKGHGLSKESFNDQSGELVEYTPVPNADPPQAISPPQMPAYVGVEEESIDKNFDDIIGLNEPSKGQLPAAGIPAIGMQLLIEQDDTRLGVVTERNEQSWARVAKLMLLYAGKFWRTPRLLKVAGKQQEFIVRQFTGEDLGDQHDVIVVRGSTVPGSKTLKRQEIINAWQQGLLGDPADPKVREKVLGMVEFGDAAEMWRDHALNERQAKLMIDMLERGEVPPLHEFDNNDLLTAKINEFRKERFGELTPEQSVAIDQALNERVDAIAGQTNPEIAAEQKGVTPERLMAENPLGPDAPHPGEQPPSGPAPTQPAPEEIPA